MAMERRRRRPGNALTLLAIAVASPGFAEPRPAYQLLSFEEHWIPPVGGWDDADYFDPAKHVILGDTGFVTFGGGTGGRVEHWRNFAFGAPAVDDDEFLLHRISAFADVHLDERMRVFTELMSAHVTDRDLPGGSRPIDVNTLDFKNFFVDRKFGRDNGRSITLRLGRQQFAFGKQRLISALPWANSFNRWDGISAIVETGNWQVHGFAAYFTPVRQYDIDKPDTDDRFFGAYATRGKDFDLYYLGRARDDLDEIRHTLGFRYAANRAGGRLDYEIESALQIGDRGGDDIRAGLFTAVLGWTFRDMTGTPRIGLSVDWASGDSDPADGRLETFDQLKPLGHAYLGFIDLVGRQNILDISPSIDWRPGGQWTLKLAAHYFQRAEAGDALFNPGGAIVRAGDSDASRVIGTEFDLTAARNFGRHWSLLFGSSWLEAGDFIEQTGPDETTQFLYGMLTFKF